MAKMLWEMWLPQAIAKAKEDVSRANLWKYARYYRMYMERYSYKTKDGKDLTRAIENTLFFRGSCMLVKYLDDIVVAEVDDKSVKLDSNGDPEIVSGTSLNGKVKFNDKKVGEDCIILYADSTRIPPFLYIWALANDILELDDIIRQQNNMLRKPIMVKGEGAGFDNAVNKVMNILSGVAFFNVNERKGKHIGNAMDIENPVEVLNLQVGNAYKGIELWDNIKHKEECICDYLGYTTTKNEKRERLNSLEITNENSIGMTFYKSQTNLRKYGLENARKIKIDIVFTELLSTEEGAEENDSKKEMVGTDNNN